MREITLILFIIQISKVIAETVVSFTLFEEQPPSTLVGSIANKSRTYWNGSNEEFDSLRYNFLDQTPMQSLFVIHSGTGNLLTAIVIDREVECGFREVCHLTFDVMAHSSVTSDFLIISVKVLLVDINDHSPIFSPDFANLQISESAVIGTTIGIEDAKDADSTSQNGIKSYQILPLDGVFGLNATQKPDGSFLLKLVLKQQIDRETQSRHQIQVVAQDGGTQPNSGILNLNVEVLDDNDNSPVFSRKLYDVTINEDVDVGTSLVRVSAIDKDSGENGQILYRFNFRQTLPTNIIEMFEIDENSGVISVKSKLRYDSGNAYNISVEATDKGSQPLVDRAVVKIVVLDVKNNPPLIRINFLSSRDSGKVNVSESAKSGAVIAHVNVEDSDSGQNGEVTCTSSDSHFALRVVQGKGYVMVINRMLDRETHDSLNVDITCRDQGTPSLETTAQFVVKVLDVNDKTPEFSQSLYLTSITENNAVGDVITQISAHDLDTGVNAYVKYYLHENSNNGFAINSNTGVITANVIFDRETTGNYKFTVLAVDSGNPALTGTASVMVTINDANDNAPRFNEPMFQFFVKENLLTDVIVGSLSASDADDGRNAQVHFKLEGDSKSFFPFYILQDGTIKTNRVLNREVQSSYDFRVVAYDLGVPSRNNTTRVMVYVTDENDEAPFIRFPNKYNNSVSISYLAPVGSQIAQIDAYDSDEQGRNSQLSYEIIRGNDLDIFTIGKSTGKIFLTKTYKIEADVTFPVTVSVSDMGEDPRESTMDFHIILKFTNESFPDEVRDNGNRNIIISAVLVALTFLISAVIVTVIFIIKRNDNKTSGSDKHHEKLYSEVSPQMVTIETKQYNEVDKAVTSSDSPRKKKEVSFSLDEGQTHFTEPDEIPVFENPEDLQRHQHSTAPPRYDKAEPLQTVHLHQLSRLPIQKPLSSHDNISDSSGDVTNSDSGRGGSDLDLTQSNRAENFKMANYSNSPRHCPPIVPWNSKMDQSKDFLQNSKYNQPVRSSDTTSTDIGYSNHSYVDISEGSTHGEDWHPSYV